MSNNDVITKKLDTPTRISRHTGTLGRPLWWQVPLNVAYVLVAGPRGAAYVLVLLTGLVLDLPGLLLRLVLATTIGILSAMARTVLWLFRFGLRFLWVGIIVLVLWTLQSLRWLSVSLGIAVIRIVSTVLSDIIHPRSAWQRAVQSMRRDRERVRVPRPTSAARVWAGTASTRDREDRFVDTFADGLKRWRRQVAPGPWSVLPAIWLRLAVWERRHTMRWLNIDLPPLVPPRYDEGGRASVLSYLPLASLGYLLAKVPIGVLVVLLLMAAFSVSDLLIHSGYEVGVIVAMLVTIYVLHVTANLNARYAQRAFSPSEAMRRVQAAEALAEHERGKAARAEQSRRDLIINVGHELRTPTASILGHVESVLLTLDTPDSHMPPETLRTYLGIVQREAERLSSLVDDLLAVARAERDELQLVLAPVDAAEVIHEVHQALAPLARRERQVMLVHEEQHNLPPLLADRQRLLQVLLNLVRNAITYTPPGGIVSIAVRRTEGDQLLLTVADTGTGIAPADLDRVFERFYRADASRTRESGGFGLGLAIARDLVEAMGGTITVESVVDEGSYFHVSLPIAANIS